MLRYYIVDAFTDHPFGGNTAGVVLLENEEYPEDELMRQVAAELRYSETAFVRPLEATLWEIRYFTPRAEVELCGHATVATFALLYSLGRADGCCHVRTRAGELEVIAAPQVMMQMAPPCIVSYLNYEDAQKAYRAVGLATAWCPPIKPAIVTTGLPDVMLPMPSIEALNTLQPDMEAIAALTGRLGAVSIHPFAISTDEYTAHVRDFAPGCGIPEESATGTANAALTHYLAANGIIKCGNHSFLQGEVMGRPSVVETRLDADGGIRVGGTAAIVAEGRIFV